MSTACETATKAPNKIYVNFIAVCGIFLEEKKKKKMKEKEIYRDG
jgi:biotin-(acetyl-CoA carboxylase) ligase